NRCLDGGVTGSPPFGCADKGDMNTDGQWNGSDIQRFTNTLILFPDAPRLDVCRAGMTADGYLSLSDRDCFLRVFLGLQDPHSPWFQCSGGTSDAESGGEGGGQSAPSMPSGGGDGDALGLTREQRLALQAWEAANPPGSFESYCAFEHSKAIYMTQIG